MTLFLTPLRFLLFVAVCTVLNAPAELFQYRQELQYEDARRRERISEVYLWVPPQSRVLRGAIVLQKTGMEAHFVQDPAIRDICREQHLAILYAHGGFGPRELQDWLSGMGEASGYVELSRVPLFFVGHSAGGPLARIQAMEFADRCFGLVQNCGGMPTPDQPVPPGLPTLAIMGQYDEFGGRMRDPVEGEQWQRQQKGILAFRKQNPEHLVALVTLPGGGHFAYHQASADLVALYLKTAAETILPEKIEYDAEGRPRLNRLKAEEGWLTSMNLNDQKSLGSYGDFSGDRRKTNWWATEELARASLQFHKGLTGRKDQFLTWEDPIWVDAGARFFFTKVEWLSEDNGRRFRVNPAYRAEVPGQYNGRGPIWPDAGKPVGNSGNPIELLAVGGPVKRVDERHLMIFFNEVNPIYRNSRITFLAFVADDGEYRHTEQVGMLPRGFQGTLKGRPQKVHFEEIDVERLVQGESVTLTADSDSGLPVEFHVGYGPARIEKGQLLLEGIPLRTRYPVEVEVVAYQFGQNGVGSAWSVQTLSLSEDQVKAFTSVHSQSK